MSDPFAPLDCGKFAPPWNCRGRPTVSLMRLSAYARDGATLPRLGPLAEKVERPLTDDRATTEPKMTEIPSLLGYTTYQIVPDDVDAFRSLALRMATMAKANDGCFFLDITQDASDPALFRFIEGWRDQAALDAHGASAEFQSVIGEASALGIIDRSIHIYSVAGRQIVDLPS